MHVPYKGAGPATAAVFSGEVDYTFTSLAAAVPMVKSGKVVPLAVTSKAPSLLYPSVPTAEAARVKGYEAGDWIGLVVPAGTPKPIIARLNAALRKWLVTADANTQLAQAGFEAKASNPQEFRSLIDADYVKWQRIAKVAGIKAE